MIQFSSKVRRGLLKSGVVLLLLGSIVYFEKAMSLPWISYWKQKGGGLFSLQPPPVITPLIHPVISTQGKITSEVVSPSLQVHSQAELLPRRFRPFPGQFPPPFENKSLPDWSPQPYPLDDASLLLDELEEPELPGDVLYKGGKESDGGVVVVSVEDLEPQLREMSKRDIAKAKEEEQIKGYREVPQSAVDQFRAFPLDASPMGDVEGNLKFIPADLTETPFAHFTFEGVMPEITAVTDDGDEVTAISRFFTRDDGVLVKLYEFDHVAAEGQVIYLKEEINADVNGHPAIFSLTQSANGEMFSGLSWGTDRKEYVITVMGNIKEDGRREELFNLARSLPEEPVSGDQETRGQQTLISPFGERDRSE